MEKVTFKPTEQEKKEATLLVLLCPSCGADMWAPRCDGSFTCLHCGKNCDAEAMPSSGKTIDREAIYKSVQHENDIKNAGMYLKELTDTSFAATYGFSFEDAANPDSPHFLLEKIVECFGQNWNADVAEYDMWTAAVQGVLDELKKGANVLLYKKAEAEQKAYREALKQMSPEDIINNAYEYATREDILLSLETNDLPDAKARALLSIKNLMDALYQTHENEVSEHMNELWSCIEDYAEQAEDNEL